MTKKIYRYLNTLAIFIPVKKAKKIATTKKLRKFEIKRDLNLSVAIQFPQITSPGSGARFIYRILPLKTRKLFYLFFFFFINNFNFNF